MKVIKLEYAVIQETDVADILIDVTPKRNSPLHSITKEVFH